MMARHPSTSFAASSLCFIWLAIACTPVFVLWNPPAGVALMAVYELAANLPCIAIQRYNRPRAQRALAH